MREVKKNYIKILKLELEDLEIDIERLIESCEEASEYSDLSENVFLENLALFKNELLAVNVFENMLDKVDIEQFDNLDDMVQFIKNSFEEKVRILGFAKAINRYVERKLIKVADYVTQS